MLYPAWNLERKPLYLNLHLAYYNSSPFLLPNCSLKTVVVTLWGSAAEGAGAELEAAAADNNPVVVFSLCKVGTHLSVFFCFFLFFF
jgi:hypothetical protein